MFEKKEKINWKTGKFETVKKGIKIPDLFNKPSKDTLDYEAEKLLKKKRKQKWKHRKQTAKKVAKATKKAIRGVNKALDVIEGKPSKRKKSSRGKRKNKYVIKNGKAYPVAKPRRSSKKKKKCRIA